MLLDVASYLILLQRVMASQSRSKPLILGYNEIHPFSKVEITDRTSVQELLQTLLDPLEPHFSPSKARVRIPGGTAVRFDSTAAEVEGFCRPLWGLASLLAGGGEYPGTVCVFHYSSIFKDLYITCLTKNGIPGGRKWGKL